MELNEQVMLITGNNNSDLVSLMLTKAKAEIVSYLNASEYEEKFDNIAVDIAVIKINRLGSEGLTSQSYSGVSESYTDDYPAYIKHQLETYKRKWGML